MGYLRAFGPTRPYLATLAVNVTGGLLMGVLVAWLLARGAASERWRLLLGVGGLGGFTTFSSFSLEATLLIERRDYGAAAGYVTASVALAVGALILGLMLGRRVFA